MNMILKLPFSSRRASGILSRNFSSRNWVHRAEAAGGALVRLFPIASRNLALSSGVTRTQLRYEMNFEALFYGMEFRTPKSKVLC
jgi:hypothetical protein